MTPLLLAAAGVVALMSAGLILRTFGPRYRVARLLATTPRVTIAEANELARSGRRVYVRVDGRIDADDDFEGPEHQPLVLRRVRFESRSSGRWRVFEDQRRVVPFRVNEGLDSIGVDVGSLDQGLVVVPRESVGVAADVADRVPDGTAPDVPVRVRIDQVSSVEHAIVLGFPVPVSVSSSTGDAADQPVPDGQPTTKLTAGRSRPLVLTVLEPDEAMRVLAADGRGRTRLAGGLIAVAAALVAGAALWAIVGALAPALIPIAPWLDGLVGVALAASPEPSAATGGDPRSNGQGPGLVGTPGLAILGVATIAILAVVATTVYVRLTTSRPDDPASSSGGREGPPGSSRSGR